MLSLPSEIFSSHIPLAILMLKTETECSFSGKMAISSPLVRCNHFPVFLPRLGFP